MVADAFPWTPESCFAYTRDNHTSVVGVRGIALRAGAAAVAVDVHATNDTGESGLCLPLMNNTARERGHRK